MTEAASGTHSYVRGRDEKRLKSRSLGTTMGQSGLDNVQLGGTLLANTTIGGMSTYTADNGLTISCSTTGTPSSTYTMSSALNMK